MQETFKLLELGTAAGGAISELFDDAMAKVIANAQDPNTKADQMREINIKVKIKPTSERTAADYLVEVTTKLANVVGVANRMHFGRKGTTRQIAAYELKAQQAELGLVPGLTEIKEVSNG